MTYPGSGNMLLCAVEIGNLNVVQFLIEEAKVGIDDYHSSGEAAIHRAAARGRDEILEYLISKGADIDLPKKYPLKLTGQFDDTKHRDEALKQACERQRIGCIKILLSHGCKIHYYSDSKYHPEKDLSDEVIKLLKEEINWRKKRIILKTTQVARDKFK